MEKSKMDQVAIENTQALIDKSLLLDETQTQCQNPCDFCVDNAEEMGLEIHPAEFVYEDTCLGIKICMELCREHYLERMAMKYEDEEEE